METKTDSSDDTPDQPIQWIRHLSTVASPASMILSQRFAPQGEFNLLVDKNELTLGQQLTKKSGHHIYLAQWKNKSCIFKANKGDLDLASLCEAIQSYVCAEAMTHYDISRSEDGRQPPLTLQTQRPPKIPIEYEHTKPVLLVYEENKIVGILIEAFPHFYDFTTFNLINLIATIEAKHTDGDSKLEENSISYNGDFCQKEQEKRNQRKNSTEPDEREKAQTEDCLFIKIKAFLESRSDIRQQLIQDYCKLLFLRMLLEEDDAHKGNFGFVIEYEEDQESIKMIHMRVIDHDMTFYPSVIAQSKHLVRPNPGDAKEKARLTARSIGEFPYNADYKRYFWPTEETNHIERGVITNNTGRYLKIDVEAMNFIFKTKSKTFQAVRNAGIIAAIQAFYAVNPLDLLYHSIASLKPAALKAQGITLSHEQDNIDHVRLVVFALAQKQRILASLYKDYENMYGLEPPFASTIKREYEKLITEIQKAMRTITEDNDPGFALIQLINEIEKSPGNYIQGEQRLKSLEAPSPFISRPSETPLLKKIEDILKNDLIGQTSLANIVKMYQVTSDHFKQLIAAIHFVPLFHEQHTAKTLSRLALAIALHKLERQACENTISHETLILEFNNIVAFWEVECSQSIVTLLTSSFFSRHFKRTFHDNRTSTYISMRDRLIASALRLEKISQINLSSSLQRLLDFSTILAANSHSPISMIQRLEITWRFCFNGMRYHPFYWYHLFGYHKRYNTFFKYTYPIWLPFWIVKLSTTLIFEFIPLVFKNSFRQLFDWSWTLGKDKTRIYYVVTAIASLLLFPTHVYCWIIRRVTAPIHASHEALNSSFKPLIVVSACTSIIGSIIALNLLAEFCKTIHCSFIISLLITPSEFLKFDMIGKLSNTVIYAFIGTICKTCLPTLNDALSGLATCYAIILLPAAILIPKIIKVYNVCGTDNSSTIFKTRSIHGLHYQALAEEPEEKTDEETRRAESPSFISV